MKKIAKELQELQEQYWDTEAMCISSKSASEVLEWTKLMQVIQNRINRLTEQMT